MDDNHCCANEFDIWVKIPEKAEYTGTYAAIMEEDENDEEESGGFVRLGNQLL